MSLRRAGREAREAVALAALGGRLRQRRPQCWRGTRGGCSRRYSGDPRFRGSLPERPRYLWHLGGKKLSRGWYALIAARNYSFPRARASHTASRSAKHSLKATFCFFFRYPQKVMDKILSMAEGIKVTDAPIHTTRDELVAKVKKRGISSSNG